MEFSTPKPRNLRRVSMINSPIPMVTSSPLRRSTAAGPSNQIELVNNPDDEAERTKRRSVVDIQRRLTSISSVESPLTELNNLVDENQIKDHLKICTKLYTENKISVKNAWELHVIDVLRKVLSTGSDNVLQVVGSTLDIGAKVYGFRVDDVHTRGLKLASLIARNKEGQEQAETVTEGDRTVTSSKKAPKKRKRLVGKNNVIDYDGKIFAPPKLLEPVLFSTKEDIEVSSTDNLFTKKLPLNPENLSFMFLTGEKYWKTGEDKTLGLANELIDIEVPDFSQSKLCESFKDFEIGGDWDPEKEENELGCDNLHKSVVFDENGLPMAELDGSMPNLFEQDPAVDFAGSDVEEEVQAHIQGEIPHVIDAIPEENRIETDYGYNSYFKTESGKYIDRIWAGPSHWRVKYIKRNTARFTGSVIHHQVAKPKKIKVPQLIDFTKKPNPFSVETVVIKKTNPTVPEEKITLPVPESMWDDFETTVSRYLLKPKVPKHKPRVVNQVNQEYEVPAYNYENPNDSQYCSQNNTDDDNVDNHSLVAEEPPAACQNFLGDHLVNEPEMVTACHVPYALQAKKLNMKELKAAVWKKLTQRGESTFTQMSFSKLYEELPAIVSPTMRKELSCALVFAALLHLCNEHNLQLVRDPNVTGNDFVVKKAIF